MQYFKRYLPFYLFYGASHTSYLLTFLPLLHSRWRILLPIAYTYLIHDRTKFQKFKPNLHRTVPISLVFPWKRVRTSDTPTRLPPIHSTSPTKTLSILHFHYLIYLYYLYYLYLSYLLTKMQITISLYRAPWRVGTVTEEKLSSFVPCEVFSWDIHCAFRF